MLLAAAVGLTGVVLVCKPNIGLFNRFALIGIGSSFLAAMAFVTVRGLTATEPTTRIVLFFALIGTAISAVPLLWAGRWLHPREYLYVGDRRTVRHALADGHVRAYSYARRRIGPASYLAIIVAGIYAWILWNEVPDRYALAGAGLIFLAMLLCLKRDHGPGGGCLRVRRTAWCSDFPRSLNTQKVLKKSGELSEALRRLDLSPPRTTLQGIRGEEQPDMAVEVIGIDHIYIAVSDMQRARAFYDPLMTALGFRRKHFSIGGEPHIHYYNRHFGYVLRPASVGAAAHNPYHPGLHHFCFGVEDVATLRRLSAELTAAGIAHTPALQLPAVRAGLPRHFSAGPRRHPPGSHQLPSGTPGQGRKMGAIILTNRDARSQVLHHCVLLPPPNQLRKPTPPRNTRAPLSLFLR